MFTGEVSPSFELGHQRFKAGRFFDAHEAWEAGWRASHGAQRWVLQALVLWAAAFHHATRGNRVGALRLMTRALERLAAHRLTRPPVDVEELRDALVQSWETLRSGGVSPPAWDPVDPPATTDLELSLRTRCPYCAEPVAVEVDPELASGASYVEDCPVCCRPWTVLISDGVIALARSDE